MELFRNWLTAMSTEDLIKMVYSLSATITALRDKPFCTVRELEEMQNDLGVNRLLLQLTFEELQQNRKLSPDEEASLLSEVMK